MEQIIFTSFIQIINIILVVLGFYLLFRIFNWIKRRK